MHKKGSDSFEHTFARTLNRHATMKKKFVKANEVPYMTKALSKAIMKRCSQTLSKLFVKTVDKSDIKEFKSISNIDGLSEPVEISIRNMKTIQVLLLLLKSL